MNDVSLTFLYYQFKISITRIKLVTIHLKNIFTYINNNFEQEIIGTLVISIRYLNDIIDILRKKIISIK